MTQDWHITEFLSSLKRNKTTNCLLSQEKKTHLQISAERYRCWWLSISFQSLGSDGMFILVSFFFTCFNMICHKKNWLSPFDKFETIQKTSIFHEIQTENRKLCSFHQKMDRTVKRKKGHCNDICLTFWMTSILFLSARRSYHKAQRVRI